ncbi:DsbA family protein [Streptomyces nigra]|uniref:DsbA family protein n=1 Tax=Streptomyces nigra TaxID=1827580 RepID=UPI0036E9D2F6
MASSSPHARLAAEGAEAAPRHGSYWPVHNRLLAHPDALTQPGLSAHAAAIGLDVDRSQTDVAGRVGAARVAEDVRSADPSGVTGTPTFVINGRRHHGRTTSRP